MSAFELRHFRYEITCDWRRTALSGGEVVVGKTLTVSIVVDGETITSRQAIMDTQLPFESEIAFYSRRAVEALHEMLRVKEAAR